MKTAQEYISEIKTHIIEVSTQELLTAMLNPDVIIIDVREHDEFTTGHIEGAVNFPRGVLEMKITYLSNRWPFCTGCCIITGYGL